MTRALLLLALLLGAGPALAQPRTAPAVHPDLRRASARFEFGAWAEAAGIVQQYLAAHPTPPEQEAVLAYRILGISEWHLGDRAHARAAFVALLSEDPDFKLDPFLVPPPIVEFLEEVRREHEPTLGPLREQKRMLREQERLADEARRRLLAEERARTGPPSKVVRVQERVYALNWLPFGAGQFQNGQAGKGTAFAAGELALGAINIAAIVVHDQIINDPANRCGPSEAGCESSGYKSTARRQLRLVDAVKYTSAGLFWALYGLGVYDAHRNYVPRIETEISPREAGVTVSLRWDF